MSTHGHANIRALPVLREDERKTWTRGRRRRRPCSVLSPNHVSTAMEREKQMMKTTRILLPFTQDLDLGALECAVQFARKCHAILVPLALLPLSEHQWTHDPRLEAIEQAVDFLEAVRYKATRTGVPIEPYDMQTRDVVRSIRAFAQEMMCEGTLLFLQRGATVLLPPAVVRGLLEQSPCKC